MLFYKNVVALDKTAHRGLRFRRSDFTFASGVNMVILTGSEFMEAAKEYAIGLVRAKDGNIVSVALLGMRDGENLYVDDAGQWNARYIPAYVRRYPFIFSESGPDRLTVCIDTASVDLNPEEGDALFDETGNASPLLDQLVDFMQGYQDDLLRTRGFVERLQKHDLIQETNAMVRLHTGVEYVMNGMYVVDAEKFARLGDEAVLEFFRNGELGWIYAHLASLSNLQRQADLLAERSPTSIQ